MEVTLNISDKIIDDARKLLNQKKQDCCYNLSSSGVYPYAQKRDASKLWREKYVSR